MRLGLFGALICAMSMAQVRNAAAGPRWHGTTGVLFAFPVGRRDPPLLVEIRGGARLRVAGSTWIAASLAFDYQPASEADAERRLALIPLVRIERIEKPWPVPHSNVYGLVGMVIPLEQHGSGFRVGVGFGGLTWLGQTPVAEVYYQPLTSPDGLVHTTMVAGGIGF